MDEKSLVLIGYLVYAYIETGKSFVKSINPLQVNVEKLSAFILGGLFSAAFGVKILAIAGFPPAIYLWVDVVLNILTAGAFIATSSGNVHDLMDLIKKAILNGQGGGEQFKDPAEFPRPE